MKIIEVEYFYRAEEMMATARYETALGTKMDYCKPFSVADMLHWVGGLIESRPIEENVQVSITRIQDPSIKAQLK